MILACDFDELNISHMSKIGCGLPSIYHPAQPHDSIDVFRFNPSSISQKAVHLYQSGLSLQAVARQVHRSKTYVRKTLVESGVDLRAHSNDQLDGPVKSKSIAIKNASYGFTLVNGVLHEDPKEMAVVQLIIKWWQQGLSQGAIARKLNNQKIKPRKADLWSQPTVGFIIKRQTNK